ncbi:MAG TPA: DedA family protein [bacterium]|nr:DedA family protein [bacterium]HPJ71792.1 DedA family protein [bacterium]HPQ66897.1 DedA family protein [bacterium]
MTEHLIPFLETLAALMITWKGPLLVFVFMAIESSLIPFPSEIIMIPAGFWAARGEFFPGEVGVALAAAFALGLLGSMAGAYFNYFLALKLGRPVLHRYGRYFFLPPEKLDRSEAIFREYGEVATFVSRLIPAIRQLISLPAGLSRMNFGRFSLFTALGAGIWIAVLMAIGYHLGAGTAEMSYADIVHQGKAAVSENMIWIVPACLIFFAGYIWIHKRVMKSRAREGAAEKGNTGHT